MPLSEIILITMGLLTIAMFAAAICKNIPIPYTVFLVIIGIMLGSFSREFPNFQFLLKFQLTPDLVLFLFLPALIFESAIKMDARLLLKDITPVLVLAIPALLISAGIIGIGLWMIQGHDIYQALLFGALISATDPVAVMALFKEVGAPHRLSILVEGESLFNDATAIVFFNIILGLAVTRNFMFSDIGFVILSFLKVFFGGLLVGFVIGLILSELLYRIKAGISSYLIMSIVLAYSSFIIAEHLLHVSGVMAVVSSAIILSLFGLSRIPKNEKDTVDETWDVIALICNSLLFLLVGISLDLSMLISHLHSILVAIILVLVARAAGIYTMVPATIKIFHIPKVSIGERHIMWWGGLKGGLAMAIVLSIPIDMPGRDTILFITLGVVLFTLLINASTIRPLMEKLGFNKLTGEEVAELKHALVQSQEHSTRFLDFFQNAKLISRCTQELIQKRNEKIFGLDEEFVSDSNIERKQAYITALQIEMKELKYLYDIGFLQYYTYLTIKNSLQYDRDCETWAQNTKEESQEEAVTETRGLLMRIENAMLKQLREQDFAARFLARYQYLRFSQDLQRDIANILICGQVIEQINKIEDFEIELRQDIINKYQKRLNQEKERLEKVALDFPEFYTRYETRLFSKVSLIATDFFTEEALHNGEMGTKVFTNIKDRIHKALKSLSPITDPAPKLRPEDLIGMVPLLNGLSNNLLERLSKRASAMTFLPGDKVIGEGEKGDSLYIITHGLVKVYKNKQKNEFLAELRDGEFFGEMALLGSQIRTANVEAVRSTTLLRLTRKDILKVAEADPELKARLEEVRMSRQAADSK